MFVTSKRIPIHPDKAGNIKPEEVFETDSGMGGSFTIKFKCYKGRGKNRAAVFEILDKTKPPEGWDGEKVTIPINELPSKLYLICPECPILDKGQAEKAALKKLGYPADATEWGILEKRTQPLRKRTDHPVHPVKETQPEFKTRWGPKKIAGFDNPTLLRLRDHIENNPINRNDPETQKIKLTVFKKEAIPYLDRINSQIAHNLKMARLERGEPVNEDGFSGRKSKKRR